MPKTRVIDVPASGCKLDQMVRSGRFGRPVDLAQKAGLTLTDLDNVRTGVAELDNHEVAIYAELAQMSVKDFCNPALSLRDERSAEQRVIDLLCQFHDSTQDKKFHESFSLLYAIPHKNADQDFDFPSHTIRSYLSNMQAGVTDYNADFVSAYATLLSVDLDLLQTGDWELFCQTRKCVLALRRVEKAHEKVTQAQHYLAQAQQACDDLVNSLSPAVQDAYERISTDLTLK